MAQLLDPLLIMALALNFVALGVSRIRGVINAVAFQGILLGILAAVRPPGDRLAGRPAGRRDDRPEGIRDPEVPRPRHARGEHPARGQADRGLHELAAAGGGRHRAGDGVLVHAAPGRGAPALAAGAGLALDGLDRLPPADDARKAIMQVLGYLLLENGIFLFGLLLLEAMPFLVEVGVLLDLFTGVFVMGIIIHHISREFASISTEHLTELKE